MTLTLPTSPAYSLAYALSQRTQAIGGRALLVGGCVRDAILGIPSKDVDVEVFGVAEDKMDALLGSVAGTNVLRVGRSFPVWKIWSEGMDQGSAIDVALPRRGVQTGVGHTDFGVTLDPSMSFEAAVYRRDFTINAIGYDMVRAELLDPYLGAQDLQYKWLRCVSELHFGEDPLRVLRGMQFCARFRLIPTQVTVQVCSKLTPLHLSPERIWDEWRKLILKGTLPRAGLAFLRETGWVNHFPEVAAMDGVPQRALHHPEGDVLTHTAHCLDAFAHTRIGDEREDLIVGLATLCHDMGKATTTRRRLGPFKFSRHIPLGHLIAHGHEEAGEVPTRSFLSRMTTETDLINEVASLVVHHMVPTHLYNQAHKGETPKMMNRSIRRLSQKVRLDRLARLVLIDKSGRPPKPAVSPEADWLLERAAALEVKSAQPTPILMGRHLIEMGVNPGVEMGTILHEAFQHQLDGEITNLEEAIEWVKTRI